MAKKAIKKKRGRPPGKRSLVSKAKRVLTDVKAGRYKVGTFKVDENGVKKLHWTQRRKIEQESLIEAARLATLNRAALNGGWSVVHENAEQANLKDAEAKRAWQAAQEAKSEPSTNKAPPSIEQVTILLRQRLVAMEDNRNNEIASLRHHVKEMRNADEAISKIDEAIKQIKHALAELT